MVEDSYKDPPLGKKQGNDDFWPDSMVNSATCLLN